MKSNRVKMFARKISATDRLVRSPPAFASPRERSSATWALVRPAAGVSAIAAPGAGGMEATASAMPGHRTAVKGQRNARPSRGQLPATSTAPLPPAPRLTVPQTPSAQVAPAPIVNGVVAAIAILLACLQASANPASSALERQAGEFRRDTVPLPCAKMKHEGLACPVGVTVPRPEPVPQVRDPRP